MASAGECTPGRQVDSPGSASTSTRESLGVYTPEPAQKGPKSDTTSSSAEKLPCSGTPPASEANLHPNAWMGSGGIDTISKLPTPSRSAVLPKQSDPPLPCRSRSEEPDPCRERVRRCCAPPPAAEEDWLAAAKAPTPQKQARSTQLAGPISYKMSLDDPVGGIPTRSGELMLFDPLTGGMKPWTVLLFTNGFYAVARGTGSVHSFAWSPFSLLHEERAAKVQGAEESLFGRGDESCFTLSILPHDMGFVFGSRAQEAKKDIRQWVDDMSKTLRFYTKSLFPPFALSVEPVEGNPSTRNRIVAGYLLQEERDGTLVVVYCELQAHKNGKGMLVLYESERCERFLSSITINADTVLRLHEGVDCSLFMVSVLSFCARSVEERSLWHRALDNVRVKCRNEAPDPTAEDLRSFRSAVLERVVRLELFEAAHRLGATAAHLNPVVPPLRLGGIQATSTGIGDVFQSSTLRCPPPRRRSASANVTPSRGKFPVASPRLRPAGAPPAPQSLSREDAGGGPEVADDRYTPVPSRANSVAEEGSTSPPEPSSTAAEKFMLCSPAKEASNVDDISCEEIDTACHKPPASAPGPGLHDPPWLRPHPGAMRRVTDLALSRLKDGILSL